ncbi:hypothetical protein [Candidatus Nanohalococcus occultus]|uniref:hypothetical protein n=1 Tax=Candidatus Nanohalococcus occultus TaxID=2978047 RepID=UPI0039E0EF85
MASPAITLMIYFSAIFMGSLVFNFIAIHSMANIVLYKGASRSKSLSLSTEFAFLTAVVPTSLIALAQVMGQEVTFGSGLVFYAIAGVSTLLVEPFKIWYVKEVFETNYIYAVMIAEGLAVFISILVLVLSNTVLALV